MKNSMWNWEDSKFIPNRFRGWLTEAVHLADGIKRNEHKQYSVIAMTLDTHGKLISIGTNSYEKTHPLQAKYARMTGNPHRIYLHAEIDALTTLKRIQPRTLIVARVNRFGPCNAMPCDICSRAAVDLGINKVVYTTDFGSKLRCI